MKTACFLVVPTMSLEDPLSLQYLPKGAPIATTAARPRHTLKSLSFRDVPAFGNLLAPPPAPIEEDEMMSLRERLTVRCNNVLRKYLRKVLLSLLCLLATLFVVGVGRFIFGYEQLVPHFVTADMRDMHSAYSPNAYVWLGDRRDDKVAEHVVAARKSSPAAGELVLVAGALEVDLWPATAVTCRELLAAHLHSALMIKAQSYLSRARTVNCVCAPQFGSNVSYVAFRRSAADSDGDNNNDSAQHAIVHMFNPVDSTADEYEQLDADRFVNLGVGLVIEQQANQDYRYNRKRGTFALLRRTKLSLVGVDATCERNRVAISGAMVFEAHECLDLLRGVDVRERARRQFARGVKLNEHLFQKTHASVDL